MTLQVGTGITGRGDLTGDMLEILIPAFVTLFVMIDPIGLIPIFAVLTDDGDAYHRRNMALKGVLVAGGVLLTFAILGDNLLKIFGVSMSAFRIAGGLLLFLVSIEMVFDQRTRRHSDAADKFVEEKSHADDVSVFPLAIPFIAGPGSITSIILIMGQHQGEWALQASIVAIAIGILLITYACFRLSGKLMQFMGATVTAVISRLLGVITAAISVQFIIDGIKATFGI